MAFPPIPPTGTSGPVNTGNNPLLKMQATGLVKKLKNRKKKKLQKKAKSGSHAMPNGKMMKDSAMTVMMGKGGCGTKK